MPPEPFRVLPLQRPVAGPRRAESGPAPLSLTLDVVEAFLRRYVAFPVPEQPVAIALWVMHTYAVEQAETSPYLAITSPEKRSGKTRLLDVLEQLVARPWRVVGPSEAVVFRKLAADRPTLMLDEVDAIFGRQTAGQHEGLRAILNAGNRKGTTVPRVAGEGKKLRLEEFDVFGAKALAGIGSLPDTIADRSIPIRLERRARGDDVERFRFAEARDAAEPLRAALEAHARVPFGSLRPEIPDALDDRAADGWEPLLAVADHAAGAWPRRARLAAVVLSGSKEPEDESLGIQLLTDIRSVFAEQDVDRLSTSELLSHLKEIEESPWTEWRDGRALGAHGLSRLLRPFNVRPRVERIGGRLLRGYLRDAFRDAWDRYLPPPSQEPQVRNTVNAERGADPDDARAGASVYGVTDLRPSTEGTWDPEGATDDDAEVIG